MRHATPCNSYYTFVKSPLGELLLVSDGVSLTHLAMEKQSHGPKIASDWQKNVVFPLFTQAERQLAEYFAGRRRTFDLPLHAEGTPFQKKVWAALLTINYGETISYGELARRIGQPKAARAVGLANGRNPLSIFIPCHRVVGKSGSLTGYGGGIDRKKKLLDLESSVTN